MSSRLAIKAPSLEDTLPGPAPKVIILDQNGSIFGHFWVTCLHPAPVHTCTQYLYPAPVPSTSQYLYPVPAARRRGKFWVYRARRRRKFWVYIARRRRKVWAYIARRRRKFWAYIARRRRKIWFSLPSFPFRAGNGKKYLLPIFPFPWATNTYLHGK